MSHSDKWQTMMFIKDLTKPDIATMEIFQHMHKHCRLLNYDLVHPERLWLANRDPGLGVGCMKTCVWSFFHDRCLADASKVQLCCWRVWRTVSPWSWILGGALAAKLKHLKPWFRVFGTWKSWNYEIFTLFFWLSDLASRKFLSGSWNAH